MTKQKLLLLGGKERLVPPVHKARDLGLFTIVADGTPGQLQKNVSPIVHQFMDGLSDGPVAFHYPASDYEEQLLGPEPTR